MSVGLPGTGIGGLFYLMSALCMPFREAYRAVTRGSDSGSRALALRQTLLALGVLGGIWLAGWMIGLVLSHAPAVAAALNAGPRFAGRSSNFLRIASFVLTFATLIAVVGLVEVLVAVRRWWAPRVLDAPTGSDRRIARPAT